MKNFDNTPELMGARMGICFSDLLFAYRKETARILKMSNGSYELNLSQAFDKLKNSEVLTSDEAENLLKCALETIRARTGKADIKRTLVFLQNSSAKALINRNTNNLYLNYLNLCIGLVREVGDIDDSVDDIPVLQSRSATLPGGSGAAILTGAAVGAVIGFEVGGGAGAIIGAAVGALVGASNDIEVSSDPQPQ